MNIADEERIRTIIREELRAWDERERKIAARTKQILREAAEPGQDPPLLGIQHLSGDRLWEWDGEKWVETDGIPRFAPPVDTCQVTR